MESEQIFEVGDVTLLPIRNIRKIDEIIKKYDGVFMDSVVGSPHYETTLEKIYDNAVFVATCLNGEVVGYAAFYVNDSMGSIAYLTLIAVAEEYQKMKMGSYLLEYIKSVALGNGMKKIRLEVNRENYHAIEFYKKHYFVYECEASDKSDYMICAL